MKKKNLFIFSLLILSYSLIKGMEQQQAQIGRPLGMTIDADEIIKARNAHTHPQSNGRIEIVFAKQAEEPDLSSEKCCLPKKDTTGNGASWNIGFGTFPEVYGTIPATHIFINEHDKKIAIPSDNNSQPIDMKKKMLASILCLHERYFQQNNDDKLNYDATDTSLRNALKDTDIRNALQTCSMPISVQMNDYTVNNVITALELLSQDQKVDDDNKPDTAAAAAITAVKAFNEKCNEHYLDEVYKMLILKRCWTDREFIQKSLENGTIVYNFTKLNNILFAATGLVDQHSQESLGGKSLRLARATGTGYGFIAGIFMCLAFRFVPAMQNLIISTASALLNRVR